MTEKVMTVYRVWKDIIPPMPADKAALGGLPSSALQYCEAVRTATSYGWYIFPPQDFVLRYDGRDTYVRAPDGSYSVLSSLSFDAAHWAEWDATCPAPLRGIRLPYLSMTSVSGFIQIWTGMFISTIDNYSLAIGPMVNVNNTGLYDVYQGIVETDVFKPMPLFLQIKLKKTDTDIPFLKTMPFFQIQPIHRLSYHDIGIEERVGFANSPELVGMLSTSRSLARPERPVGSYAVSTRKRAKDGEEVHQT